MEADLRAGEKKAGRGGGDVRDWDEDGYRSAVLHERELGCRTVFRAVFAPSASPGPEVLVVASSDGSVATYSIPSVIASSNVEHFTNKAHQLHSCRASLADPTCFIQAHKGPSYDVKFYGDGEDSLLLSCGDDGRIWGWNWKEILQYDFPMPVHGSNLNPCLNLVNPQHKGPWDALSPIPETNAIDVNEQEGSIFSAAGDACAYSWDVETSKRKIVFRGHENYLHSVVARKSSNQIITGSDDGSARIWDCRNGKCVRVIYPEKGSRLTESSWVSCMAIDASESWLVCGTGMNLSVWSLPYCECIWSIDSHVPVQDVLFHGNQILAVGSEPTLTRFNISGTALSQIQCAPQSAFSVSCHPSGIAVVGGYGGLVDVISEFGSHLCTFHCQGL